MGLRASRSYLRKEDLDLLVQETSYNKILIKEWYKVFRKTSPTGYLTCDTFLQLCGNFFPAGNPCHFSEYVYSTFGSKRQGISLIEYVICIHECSSTKEARLRRAFKLYDIDRDGMINLKDITTVFTAISDLHYSSMVNVNKDARELLQRLDQSGNGQVTEKEFVRGLCLGSSLECLV